jgi:hypothetical protein
LSIPKFDLIIEKEASIFQISNANKEIKEGILKLGFIKEDKHFIRRFDHYKNEIKPIFECFCKKFPTMIDQIMNNDEIPCEKSLKYFLELIKDHDINYWILGSAALSLGGIDIQPKDIDLVTDYKSAIVLGDC